MRRFTWLLLILLTAAPRWAAGQEEPGARKALEATWDSLAVEESWLDRPALDSAEVDSVNLARFPAGPPDYLAEMRANFTPLNRIYSALKVSMRFLEPLYAILAGALLLFSGLAAWLREIAHNLGRRRWVRVLAFFTFYAVIMFVVSFPLEWYDGFVLEHRFGLSDQSFPDWLGDQGKLLMLNLFFLGVVPVLWLVYTLIAHSPRRWWLWLGMAALPLTIAVVVIEPVVVDPMFNRFQPLENQQLEARIVDLAQRAGIPGRRVVEVNKSQQTKKFNAYVNGFGVSQRIVLWDTMLRGMREDEILFVMGHEMGHYRLGHIWKGIVFTWLLSLLIFGATALISGWAISRFGQDWGFTRLDDVASLPLLMTALSLVLFLAQPLINGFSRGMETEADVYALEITRDNDAAARAFIKLGEQNKSNPEPSGFVRWVLYSHPTPAERVTLAATYRPWAEGRPNRLYLGK